MAMRVTQAVFGVFHHFELAHQLHRRGHLKTIYSTWPWARVKREGLPRELVGTFPLLHTADYLLARTRFYPFSAAAAMNKWNAVAFDRWTERTIEPCDAFIAISGAGLATGRKVQGWGGRFICDRGSTHQRFQEAVMAEEYRRWGVAPPPPTPHIAQREEEIYATADAITVPSTVAQRSFVEMGVAEEKVHVIPYGVRLDKFAPAERPAAVDGFEVLFAGQIGLRKGVPYLLEAFARVQHPRKHLTMVGSVQEEFRPLLARLPTENVTFIGTIPQGELAARMAQSHVFALASVEEGLAMVQGQALASGCPVVATRATGAEDLFRDGVEGFIVPDREVEALAERLQQLADDAELRQRMAAAGLERVRSLGGWDDYGERWDTLLHKLTGKDRNASEA